MTTAREALERAAEICNGRKAGRGAHEERWREANTCANLILALRDSLPPVSVQNDTPAMTPDFLMGWLKAWWERDEFWRLEQRSKFSIDFAQMMRGVADMIECAQSETQRMSPGLVEAELTKDGKINWAPDTAQPPASEAFTDWLCREMPEGTVIGDPKWWAPRIMRALRSDGGTAKVPEGIAKVIRDLKWMRETESKGIMAMANSDDTMFESCVSRLEAMLAAAPSPSGVEEGK